MKHCFSTRTMPDRLHRSFSLLAVLFFLLIVLNPVMAKTLNKREAGLWEIKTIQEADWGDLRNQMQAMLEQIPEAQRQQFEQTLKQSGVLPSGEISMQECVTPEMAAKDFEPYFEEDMQCKHKLDILSATEAKLSFSCTGSDGHWKGQGRVWDLNSRHYRSEMQLAGKVDDNAVTMDMTQEGRWLHADCQ